MKDTLTKIFDIKNNNHMRYVKSILIVHVIMPFAFFIRFLFERILLHNFRFSHRDRQTPCLFFVISTLHVRIYLAFLIFMSTINQLKTVKLGLKPQ